MAKKNVNVVSRDETTRLALSRVNNALSGERQTDDKDKLAMNFLNHEVRREQLTQSKHKLQWSVAKMFVDKKQMAKYRKATMPVINKILNP